jgi:hypothetical protein
LERLVDQPLSLGQMSRADLQLGARVDGLARALHATARQHAARHHPPAHAVASGWWWSSSSQSCSLL